MNAIEAAERPLLHDNQGWQVWREQVVGGRRFQWRDVYQQEEAGRLTGRLELLEGDEVKAACPYSLENGRLTPEALERYWAYNERCREIVFDQARWGARFESSVLTC